MRLLVAEDEKDLNKILSDRLRSEQYIVDSCYDSATALEYMRLEHYDGAIFDVMLPRMSGFELLREIRRRGDQTPVLFLTARGDTRDIVKGLDLGASDYMVKPFQFSELLARLRVILRERHERNENIYQCGDIVLNTNDRTVTRAGRVIDLTAREYALLLYLIRNKNIVLTRQQIEYNVWEPESDISSNIVDVYIRFIRKKLNADGSENMIHAIRGMGYVLKCATEKED